jgi:hypothetical protein
MHKENTTVYVDYRRVGMYFTHSGGQNVSHTAKRLKLAIFLLDVWPR